MNWKTIDLTVNRAIRRLQSELDSALIVLPRLLKFIAGQITIILAFMGIAIGFPHIETWILLHVPLGSGIYSQLPQTLLSLSVLFLIIYGLWRLIAHMPKAFYRGPMPLPMQRIIFFAGIIVFVSVMVEYFI
jgi:hypothetical protein